MNAIGGFSAPLNGFRPGHTAKMSSRQMQETGLSGTHPMTGVENRVAGREARRRLGPNWEPLPLGDQRRLDPTTEGHDQHNDRLKVMTRVRPRPLVLVLQFLHRLSTFPQQRIGDEAWTGRLAFGTGAMACIIVISGSSVIRCRIE
jgi:hypothetical protein